MDLKQLQNNWEQMGKEDPLWAIITKAEKKGNKWDPQEFFLTGERKIEKVLKNLKAAGISFPMGRALDFGCGVGRLTQPLCRFFDSAVGVDIAPSMIEGARQYNQYGDRCSFYVNDQDDLSLFDSGSFDFIYSCIVLQHMQPLYARSYIREFLRLLSKDGVAVFQLPSRFIGRSDAGFIQRLKLKIKDRLPEYLFSRDKPEPLTELPGAEPIMEMYGIEKKKLLKYIQSLGAEVIHIEDDDSPGPEWESFQYTIRKRK